MLIYYILICFICTLYINIFNTWMVYEMTQQPPLLWLMCNCITKTHTFTRNGFVLGYWFTHTHFVCTIITLLSKTMCLYPCVLFVCLFSMFHTWGEHLLRSPLIFSKTVLIKAVPSLGKKETPSISRRGRKKGKHAEKGGLQLEF